MSDAFHWYTPTEAAEGSAGTIYTVSIDVTSTFTVGIQRNVGLFRNITSACNVLLQKNVSIIRNITTTCTVGLQRSISKTMAITSTFTVGLTERYTALKSINVTSTFTALVDTLFIHIDHLYGSIRDKMKGRGLH